MYFAYGWPKILRVPEADPPSPVSQVLANRDRIIFAVITHSTLSIWTSKPCLPVVSHQRSLKSVEKLGPNVSLIWKPDSTSIVVVTAGGYLLFYGLGTGTKTLFEQVDPESHKLRRESDELFLKEPIPAITISLLLEVAVRGRVIGSVSLFRDELMVSTDENKIWRYRWDGSINNDFCIDLRRIPFSLDQQASRAIPLQEANLYPIDFHYSPTIGGFSLVLSDGRAAYMTATTKNYDPNSVQGIWAPNIDDATCSCVSHKYRLLSFGRKNAETSVYSVDDQSGGLQHLFDLKLSSKDFPGSPGPVQSMAWTPDGCAIAISWEKGGFAIWSVFGSLLTSSWSWTGDFSAFNQRIVRSFDWAAEGYQLWMAIEPNYSAGPPTQFHHQEGAEPINATRSGSRSSLSEICLSKGVFGVLSFVKSALTVNPGMSQIEHLYLQGEDRLLINFSGDSVGSSGPNKNGNNVSSNSSSTSKSSSARAYKPPELVPPLGNNKNWVVIPVPDTYLATNWPIRYTAMDPDGLNIAISGRYGLAHYSVIERKWKLFGNEAQEHDFVVVGGMMWWDSFLVVAVYDIAQDRDELRFYPRDSKLDNRFALVKRLPSQILLLSLDRDKLLTFAADSTLAIFQLRDNLKADSAMNPATVDPCECMQTIDVGALCVHPACVISVYLTTLKTSFASSSTQQHSVVINVSGRLMILHHEYLVQDNNHGNAPQYITPTVLASCVEMVWLPRANVNYSSGSSMNHNLYLSEALWLYCGQEMRVWLPLREKSQSSVHTFISNRIMLGFPVSIYPLTILFDKAIILGAENDTLSYTGNTTPDAYGSPNTLFPFCILQRTSQVYLHQILRQLIRRNLGYYAWEIARSCSKLQYFPHSLELLLHEVLEEEATSKEPIPDALLPSVIEFVREFPVYLRTVGQCARKTELALWPHLFSVAGRPRALFDECLQRGQLDIAATYLLVIQNLESPTVSRKFATQLMDKALENRKLDLVKDLVRFLKAIDPSDIEPTPRTSIPKFNSAQTPPISPNEYDISMVLGTMQVPRMRSLSTSVVPKFPELSHRDLSRANSDNRGGSSSMSPSPNQSAGSPFASPQLNTSGSQVNASGSSQLSPGSAVSNVGSTQLSAAAGHGDIVAGVQVGPDSVNGGYDKGSIGNAYVDAIVERHARRILAEGKLRDLGKLAAQLDFHLVSWLRKEKRRRPIMVTDFVAALKMIHTEFEWKYPDYVGGHSRTPSSDSIKFPSPETTSPLKPISVDVLGNRMAATKLNNNGNDSGYNSTPGNNHVDPRDGQSVEARLVPHAPTTMDDTLSVLSEESVLMDQSMIQQADFLPVFNMAETAKASSMNSSKSGIELRFMQQLMWEAGVLDWSLIISIVLRDPLGVVRTVNSSRDQCPEIIRNLRDGLVSLSHWANTQCLGYKTFITAINNQVGGHLAKYLAASSNQIASPSQHGELNRRKTEPVLATRTRLLSGGSSTDTDSGIPKLGTVGKHQSLQTPSTSFSSVLESASESSESVSSKVYPVQGSSSGIPTSKTDGNLHNKTEEAKESAGMGRKESKSMSDLHANNRQNGGGGAGEGQEEDEEDGQGGCIIS